MNLCICNSSFCQCTRLGISCSILVLTLIVAAIAAAVLSISNAQQTTTTDATDNLLFVNSFYVYQ